MNLSLQHGQGKQNRTLLGARSLLPTGAREVQSMTHGSIESQKGQALLNMWTPCTSSSALDARIAAACVLHVRDRRLHNLPVAVLKGLAPRLLSCVRRQRVWLCAHASIDNWPECHHPNDRQYQVIAAARGCRPHLSRWKPPRSLLPCHHWA